MRSQRQILISLFILVFLPFTSAALEINQEPVKPKAPTAIIDNKPITIDADNQQIDIEKNTITFSGNVIIVQDGLTIKADKVMITDMQDTTKQIITAYGKPVRFEQIMQENNKKITGHSNELIYNVKKNNVILKGNAQLFQQDNHISSELITYDVDKQQIVALPGKNGRVKTTIVPSQVKGINK